MKRVLQVFAKAPVPGEVKTRLHPALGAQGATDLHRVLVERTLGLACSLCDPRAPGLCAIELWCAPDDAHPFFRDCAHRFGVTLRVQQGADLGERMHFALADALARGALPVLIGTDCPSLTAAHLAEAFAAIDARSGAPGHLDAEAQGNTADLVLLPTEDGGYALIGAARIDPRLFSAVAWSSPAVFEQTLARVAHLGWRLHRMATGWDLDRPEDLPRLHTLAPHLLATAVPGLHTAALTDLDTA